MNGDERTEATFVQERQDESRTDTAPSRLIGCARVSTEEQDADPQCDEFRRPRPQADGVNVRRLVPCQVSSARSASKGPKSRACARLKTVFLQRLGATDTLTSFVLFWLMVSRD